MRLRIAFAHDAVIDLDGDEAAPGAAVTTELCGTVDHGGACPLAPHHTSVRASGGHAQLRVLFATEEHNEGLVRGKIRAALARGHFTGRGGEVSRWRLLHDSASEVAADETDHAERLTRRG